MSVYLITGRYWLDLKPDDRHLTLSDTGWAKCAWGKLFGPWSEGGFSTLAAVRTLFDNPWTLLAGWAHYLAFDLFIGGWQVRDAQRHGIRYVLIVPALVLTFLFGPAGWLLYMGIRRFAGAGPRPAPGIDFGS